jgi:hypothetical protein
MHRYQCASLFCTSFSCAQKTKQTLEIDFKGRVYRLRKWHIAIIYWVIYFLDWRFENPVDSKQCFLHWNSEDNDRFANVGLSNVIYLKTVKNLTAWSENIKLKHHQTFETPSLLYHHIHVSQSYRNHAFCEGHSCLSTQNYRT